MNHVLKAASIAWCSAVSLGLLFSVYTGGRLDLGTLRLPGVVPVAVLGSSAVAALVTPLVYWTLRARSEHLMWNCLGLFGLLAIYIILITPRSPALGLYGSILLGVVGLLIIGGFHRP